MAGDLFDKFAADITETCRKHGAVIFSRKDSKQTYLSVQIGDVWVDLQRISKDGVEGLVR